MQTLKDLDKETRNWSGTAKMPMLFVGHGSPMNGIEDNPFSLAWEKMGNDLPPPRAVLCISAHWFTPGTFITAMESPRTIHDFYGFPQQLFAVQYPAPGDPALAQETKQLIHQTDVELDHEWGLDHGTWSVVRRMFPKADIPVLQLSIDYRKDPLWHYNLAAEISSLRKKGVLIIGSGNMVHNLRMINWRLSNEGFDWAQEMNEKFKKLILTHQHEALIHYEKLGEGARLAIPTAEHYLPLIYIMGLRDKDDTPSLFNDQTVMGSISMTSVLVS